MRTSDKPDTVHRLYDRLAKALRRSRREGFTAPVTVAEIYQELVPYRSVREELGFAMNADYEHVLLRLLAGEGEWLRLEPAAARDVIVRELKSPNPNVSVYREYAGCDVWVREPDGGLGPTADFAREQVADLAWLDRLDETEGNPSFSFVEPEEAPEAGSPDGAGAAAGAGSTGGDAAVGYTPAPPARTVPSAAADAAAAQPARAATPPAPVKEGTASAPAAAATAGTLRAEPAVAARAHAAGTRGVQRVQRVRVPEAEPAAPGVAASRPAEGGSPRCVFCDSDLPARRQVLFCPFCGGDQTMRPCNACGDALEAGWSYCVACGAAADG
jgi:hypothetical protein